MKSAKPPAMASKPPVTVLQLIPALNDGGTEEGAVQMALYLKQQGWRPLVASNGGKKVDILEKNGVPHLLIPLQRKAPWMIALNAWRLFKVIKEAKVGLVHARSRAPAWAGWIACKLSGVPFVTTFHGTYNLQGGWLKRFYNSVMVRGELVIANSQFIASHVIENYNISPQKVVVAQRGVDAERFDVGKFDEKDRIAVRRELDVGEKVPLVMLVGRLARWKGQELLLRAMALISTQPWKLALVGGDGGRSHFTEKLEKMAENLGILDKVVFTGSRQDVPRLLSAANLGLSCSIEPEAFGRVAIEAMAMGVPVIATGLGGSLETIIEGKTGWLVHPDANGMITPQALAERIAKSLKDLPQMARMGRAARSHVLAHFTAAKCCAAEMRAYLRVLHRE